jgi:hypothetical protein
MVINLGVVGHRHFYDYSLFEALIDDWIDENGIPDLIVCGGASGTDYLAERWADNNNIPTLIFREEWSLGRSGMEDGGRPEAAPRLTEKIVKVCTHLIAFAGEDSKWTHKTVDLARELNLPVEVHEVET